MQNSEFLPISKERTSCSAPDNPRQMNVLPTQKTENNDNRTTDRYKYIPI
jgi:hypothetical protein